MDDRRRQMIDDLRNASPLDIVQRMKEIELYDARSTREIIDEVYQQFDSSENVAEDIVKPVFLSIADGLLECTKATRNLRQKGLTASRLVNECVNFSYERPIKINGVANGYNDAKNARENIAKANKRYGENRDPYDRAKIDDDSKRYYRATKAQERSNSSEMMTDEYTGMKNIYLSKDFPDADRLDPTGRFQAQADHIVPLKQVYEHYKNDITMSEGDMAVLANMDENLAMTAARINQGETDANGKSRGGKGASTNEEFVADQNRREEKGKPNLGLSEETKERMRNMSQEAKNAMEQKEEESHNKRVLNNITGNGNYTNGERQKKIKEKEKELGRKLTPEEKKDIENHLAHKQQKVIVSATATEAAKQARGEVIGNVIVSLIKPLYYEISDSVRHGIKDGVGAQTFGKALILRFGRLKDYAIKEIIPTVEHNMVEFVKAFISSLIENIINLFAGMVKKVLKAIKEGLRIFSQACTVLFGKNAKQMSSEEKGDAIIKIIGGGIVALCGLGIESLLGRLGLPDEVTTVLATILSGIASILFMLLLDKLDLFSTKASRRHARIIEIFDNRIRKIDNATQKFGAVAVEKLREQKMTYESISYDITQGIINNDTDAIVNGWKHVADFFEIDLPYTDTESFLKWMEENKKIII